MGIQAFTTKSALEAAGFIVSMETETHTYGEDDEQYTQVFALINHPEHPVLFINDDGDECHTFYAPYCFSHGSIGWDSNLWGAHGKHMTALLQSMGVKVTLS